MATRRPLTVTRPQLLTQGSDVAFREFLHAFMVFARRLESIRDVLAREIGVTAPQYEILSHLRECHSEGGLAVHAIAERLHCTGAFATTEVGKLCHAGLVTKQREKEDARRVRVRITALCERRFRAMALLHSQLNDTLFQSVTARQFAMLHELFPALAHDGDRAVALAAAGTMTAASR